MLVKLETEKMGLSAVNFLITVENNSKWSGLHIMHVSLNRSNLDQYQIWNQDITILLGNQMQKQTITINTSSKNSITSQTQEQWEIKQTTVTRT